MKIVLWIGNESNQRALAHKLHQSFPLAGIVTESRKTKRKISFLKIGEKVIEKLLMQPLTKAWLNMKEHYTDKYPDYPAVKRLDVGIINSDEVFDFTQNLDPDLIIVSGTALIKQKLLSLQPRVGIINLHTGLSPYIKGGPNCTNWCLATEQIHLIGNTIMWIDAGIDTGNLIKTERTYFTGEESLSDVHIKVMEHAHDIYIRSVKELEGGVRTNVPQNTIAVGKTYYTKQWGIKEKWAALKNFKKFLHHLW